MEREVSLFAKKRMDKRATVCVQGQFEWKGQERCCCRFVCFVYQESFCVPGNGCET